MKLRIDAILKGLLILTALIVSGAGFSQTRSQTSRPYRLMYADTTNFPKHNYYEFKLDGQVYKVIAPKMDTSSAEVDDLKVGKHYILDLEEVKTVTLKPGRPLDLERLKVTSKGRENSFGGDGIPVYRAGCLVRSQVDKRCVPVK